VEGAEGDIPFVSTDEQATADAAKALVDGGKVFCKVLGSMLYYISRHGGRVREASA
jgi:hypothetical protein